MDYTFVGGFKDYYFCNTNHIFDKCIDFFVVSFYW